MKLQEAGEGSGTQVWNKRSMRIALLASGSEGNACLVETEDARVLIDAGLSCRETVSRLKSFGVEPQGLDALIITHEHSDHIKGAGPIARRYKVPVYANAGTFEKGSCRLGKLPDRRVVNTGESIDVRGLRIETFTKCHDAADPMGLVLSKNGAKVGFATDLGRSTRLVEDRLSKCQALILEFNYDKVMLATGPYPPFLKKRINGPDGHLSNVQAGELLRSLAHSELRFVVLAHLSKKNNEVEKAYAEAENALDSIGSQDTVVLVSGQDAAGPLLEL